ALRGPEFAQMEALLCRGSSEAYGQQRAQSEVPEHPNFRALQVEIVSAQWAVAVFVLVPAAAHADALLELTQRRPAAGLSSSRGTERRRSSRSGGPRSAPRARHHQSL